MVNKLLEMEVFVAVVDAGSLTGAAEHLDVAKSAISKRLSDLENRLGTRLLNRTTRRLSLTETGTDFYARCQRILNEVNDAEAFVAEADQALGGSIRITAPLSFGLQHLGPALVQFMHDNPDISVNVDFNDRQVDMVAEGFDVGIRIAALGDSSLMARRLAPVRMVVCASPDYWQEHGKPAEPSDLKQCEQLHYSHAPNRNLKFTAPDGSRGSVTIPVKHASNNGDFLVEAAAKGAGVVHQPLFIAHRLIASGRLEPALTEFNWNDIDVWAVYPQTRRLPGRVRVLIDYLASCFGEKPYWEDCLNR